MGPRTALITGGMGFMGSHLRDRLAKLYEHVIVVDSFTYAARPLLEPLHPHIKIERCDIKDHWALSQIFEKWKPEVVFHLAAESHVCRSIEGPRDFFHTNAIGTFHVAAESNKVKARLIHISTDEVFGEIKKGRFTECSPYQPRSPYAASKASGDHIVRCYGETFGLDYIVIHPSNNFGPNQHEEKLVARTVLSLLSKKEIVVHGRGDHIREWLFVEDFVEGVLTLAKRGKGGNSYCLGGDFECTNLDMIQMIHSAVLTFDEVPFKLVHTDDRPTDDFRYAMNSLKAKALGYKTHPKRIKERLIKTALWYYKNARGPGTGGQG